MYTINLNINDDIVTVEYEVDIDYLIPENVETVEVTIVDCPQEIIDCFGEKEIEQLVIEGIENERETARAEKKIREYETN